MAVIVPPAGASFAAIFDAVFTAGEPTVPGSLFEDAAALLAAFAIGAGEIEFPVSTSPPNDGTPIFGSALATCVTVEFADSLLR